MRIVCPKLQHGILNQECQHASVHLLPLSTYAPRRICGQHVSVRSAIVRGVRVRLLWPLLGSHSICARNLQRRSATIAAMLQQTLTRISEGRELGMRLNSPNLWRIKVDDVKRTTVIFRLARGRDLLQADSPHLATCVSAI